MAYLIPAEGNLVALDAGDAEVGSTDGVDIYVVEVEVTGAAAVWCRGAESEVACVAGQRVEGTSLRPKALSDVKDWTGRKVL